MSGTELLYQFESFTLDGASGLLYRAGQIVPLPPKVAQTLLVLVENHGQVMDREVLLKAVWPDTFVEEGNLHHNISALRKLLRSETQDAVRIETIPKRGYRLVGEVTAVRKQPVLSSAELAGTDPNPEALAVAAPLPEPPDLAGGQPVMFSHRWRSIVPAALGILLVALVVVSLARSRLAHATQPERSFASPNSIAVLPFSNFSSDAQSDYLGDGISEELIHALTKVPGLRVVGRTSSFQFRGKSGDLRQIGAQLQARLVLEGSVQKDGERLRITAQLIDAASGLHIWSKRFDRRFNDIFAVQDEICEAIAQALRVQLAAGGQWRTQSGVNEEVYSLYLRGLKEWNRRNSAGVKAGKELFQRALAIDASYAPAWAGLADTLVHSGTWGLTERQDTFSQAKKAALRAIELDPQLPEPHTALGYIQGWYERQHQNAEVSFRRALELNPGFVWGRQRLASYLSARGRHQEAIEEYRRALDLDPISSSANSGLALTYFWARQYDRATEQCARARELDPQFPLTYYYQAHTLEQQHKYEEAIHALRQGTRLWGSTETFMLTELYAAAPGHRAEAVHELEKIKSSPAGGDKDPYQMALIYTALGDTESALSWLDRSSRSGDVWFLYAAVDPRLDPIRSDRRFQQVLAHLGSD